MPFIDAYKATALFEGKYSDNPKDKGGPTNMGITEQVARANGYIGDMKTIPPNIALKIAKTQYWDIIKCDEVEKLSTEIAMEMYDTGLNCGVGTAGVFLQRALNALNREGRDYGDLTPDGVIGPLTVYALRLYLEKRKEDGEKVLLRALNSLQGAYYISISEKREANEEFMFGWFLNRVKL